MSPDPITGAAPDERRADDVTAEATADTAGDADEPRPRRKRRRAVGGTVPPAAEPEASPRSSDDLDIAWGDQPSSSDDERFLREVPPHW